MPKIKLPTKSPHIDMTPLVDLFSLLLTFFMLTAQMRPSEVAPIDTPFSISEKPAPNNNLFMVLISKDGRIFFNVDNGADTSKHFRAKILTEMGKQYNITFNAKETEKFAKLNAFGVPMEKMKTFLDTEEAKDRDAMQTGIPIDSLNNQFSWWVHHTRNVNQQVICVIKGDGEADIKLVKKVLDILQEKNVNRFSLITNLAGKVDVKLEEEGKK